MLKIGLTGGIGSGKTAVSNSFEQLGTPIIDTDIVAREVIEDSNLLECLINTFGEQILKQDNTLDREALREVAFESSKNKSKLDQIMHPAIRHATLKEIELAKQENAKYCIVVVPLLIETNFIELVDRVLVVTAPIEKKLKWLKDRSNLSAEMAKRIMSAQCSDEVKLAHANDHIDNNNSLENITIKVKELHQYYLSLSQQTS